VSETKDETEDVAQPHRIRWDIVDGRPVRSLQADCIDSTSDPVVMVPGLGALGYLLDTFHGCSARSRAYLLDVPGFGHRRPRPCSPTVPDLVRAVTGWLRTVCDRPVVLWGHSTGAQVALRVAAAVPERVSALVLAGPTFPPALRTWPALAGALLRDLPREQLGQLPATLPYYRLAGTAAVLRCIRSGQQDAPEVVIGSVTCPVTVLRGRFDAFCPQPWAARLAASAPDGRLVTMPGAHNFPYGRGGLTAALIADAAAAGRRVR
jgi:pimeloyl-ACP methyl ester carboxylesterase